MREAIGLAACVALALALALPHLGAPSLWHDELVHVFVAKSVAAGEGARLPSGVFYPNAWGYSQLLGGVIALLGDAEWAVRMPSALISGLNVLLLYLLARRWFGPRVAIMAAFLLATSPWHVAWARQARFYELQVLCHLVFIYGAWEFLQSRSPRRMAAFGALTATAYLIGMLCSFHSILFLGAPLILTALVITREWLQQSQQLGISEADAIPPFNAAIVFLGGGALGALTMLVLYLNPNPVDQQAVFHGLGPELVDPYRLVREYYLRWLGENLGAGCLLVALLGFAFMLYRRDKRGLFAVLAFIVPLLVLTFLIGYRRPRFIFFAYPFYVLALAYGLCMLARCAKWWAGERALWPMAAMALLLLARVSWTLLLLLGDSIGTAMGDRFTLAATHPEWRRAGGWVREHRNGHAVLTTTYLASLYYVGPTDDWFPNRYLPGEVQESGKPGLGSLKELQDFVAAHPKGFFISELGRFERWVEHGHIRHEIKPEVLWVREHMRRVHQASTEDVTVYEWGGL